MLIHGAWLSARSWEHFAEYFDKRGFAVSAPEWPRKHGDVEELREHADELAGLGLTDMVDHYLEFEGLPHLFVSGRAPTRSPPRSTAGSTACSTRRRRRAAGDDAPYGAGAVQSRSERKRSCFRAAATESR